MERAIQRVENLLNTRFTPLSLSSSLPSLPSLPSSLPPSPPPSPSPSSFRSPLFPLPLPQAYFRTHHTLFLARFSLREGIIAMSS